MAWEPPPAWEPPDEYDELREGLAEIARRRMALPLWYVLGGPDGHTPEPTTDINALGRLLSDPSKRRVAADRVGNADVSTVFLALDHAWGAGPPMLFETMIFGGPSDMDTFRYATWSEAEAGHARVVARLRAVEAARARDSVHKTGQETHEL